MRRKSIKIVTGLAAVIVILGLLYVIALARSTARLQRAYAALQRDGRPMRRADVIPPIVPDSANAALLYRSAASLLKAQPIEPKALPEDGDIETIESAREKIALEKHKDLFGYLAYLSTSYVQGSIRPGRYAELKELMESDPVDGALLAIEQGTQRPTCRFDRDYESGSTMPDMLLELRQLARLLAARVRLAAESGDADRAWHFAQMHVRLADALRNDPFLVSQLSRTALARSACETIRNVCVITPPDARQCEDIAELLQTFEDTTPFVRAADGERLLFAEPLFALPRQELYEAVGRMTGGGFTPAIIHRLRFQMLAFKPRLLADHAVYLELAKWSAELLEEPYAPSDSDAYREMDRLIAKQRGLTSMWAPFGRVKNIYCRMVADVRVTRAGLGLLQYKHLHHTFPDTLDSLDGEALIDPFIQEPLHYRRQGEGFLLYSVEQDLKDNGGCQRQRKQDTDYDLIWRFPGLDGGVGAEAGGNLTDSEDD